MDTSQNPEFIKKIINITEPRFSQVIDRLQQQVDDYFKTNDGSDFQAEGYIERPGARLIRGSIGGNRIYIKISKNIRKDPVTIKKSLGKYRNEFEILKKLSADLSPFPGYNVVEPVAFFPEFHCIITLEGKGINFHDVLINDLPIWNTGKDLQKLLAYAEHAGKWLRVFHDRCNRSDDDYVDYEEIIAYAELRFKKISESGYTPFTRELEQKLQKHYERLRTVFEQQPIRKVTAHSDYCPVNVLVAEKSITVLDFPMMRKAPEYQDAARFYMQLDNLKYKKIYPITTIRELQNSFLKGFDPQLKADDPQFQLMVIQQIISHLWGLIKKPDKYLHSRLFSRWVCRQHIRELFEIVEN